MMKEHTWTLQSEIKLKALLIKIKAYKIGILKRKIEIKILLFICLCKERNASIRYKGDHL